MIRRIIIGIVEVIRREITWYKIRVWRRSRATRYTV